MADRIQLQSDEFSALQNLIDDYKRLPAVVDDDYPEMRREYESALRIFLHACAANGRLKLSFDRLRDANVGRCLKWHPAGIESWSASDWMTAIVGELGEAASLIKMRNRERDGLRGNKFSPTDKQIADEIADVAIYLDLFAAAQGIDLGRAIVDKFNEVSVRNNFEDRL